MENIGFFNKSEIDLFSNAAGKPYDAKNDKKIFSALKEGVWGKTHYWCEEVKSQLTGFDSRFGYWLTQLGKNRTQIFKPYTWAQIFKSEDNDKYIYFTVGVTANSKSLIYKIDCQREGNTLLTQEQINYFDELIGKSSSHRVEIKSNDLENYSWEKLVEETILFIEKNSPLYKHIIAKVWDKRVSISPDFEMEEYIDGDIKRALIIHKLIEWRERNTKFVADYKKKNKNVISCPGCSMEPDKVYGIKAIHFLEFHHIVPLCEKKPDVKLTFDDVTLLCPNCHRAIHKLMAEDDHKIISLTNFKKRIKNYD